MYNPPRYKAENLDEAFELMEQNPFATLVSVVEGRPVVSHLPLTPKWVGERVQLIGHLARANPMAKVLGQSPVTVIFQGAHTYITPMWYLEDDVPTWNYSAIQVDGDVQLIEDYEGILGCLKELNEHVERLWPSGWQFFVPDDLAGADVLPKAIVGFRILTNAIQFKRKLSQNRSMEDRAGVLRGLETRSDEQSRKVLADMVRLYLSSGERRP